MRGLRRGLRKFSVTSSRQVAKLGAIAQLHHDTVDPSRLGDAAVELFSIPSYDDSMRPERTLASAIGSTKLRVPGNCVLLSRINPHIPRVWLVKKQSSPVALTSTEMLVLTPRDGVSVEYLYTALMSTPFRRAMAARVSGTSTSHQRVRAHDVLELGLPLLDEQKQRRVGALVAGLAERERLCAESARAALALVRQAYARVVVRAGAERTALGRLATLHKGVSYRTEELAGQDSALVTLRSFGRDGTYQAEGLKPWSGKARDDQRVMPGEIVVAQTDLTQRAEVLGRAVIVSEPVGPLVLHASLDVAVVRPHVGVGRAVLFAVLLQQEFRAVCRSHANGTTVLHLRTRALPDFECVWPSRGETVRLAAALGPVVDGMVRLDRVRDALRRTRTAVMFRVFGSE